MSGQTRGKAIAPEQSPEQPDDARGILTARQVADLWGDASRNSIVSEDACLTLIDEFFPSRTAHVPLGRESDCAELAGMPPVLALSTDMLWEDVHFRRRYVTPQEAGAKALTVAVSDLAAAGASPMGFSLDLMLPPSLSENALRRIMRGMARVAKAQGIVLSGGDLSRGDRLGFSITVWGRPAGDGVPFLRRGAARPGDCIFLIGRTGLSGVGLWALEKQGRAAVASWPESCAAFLDPQALVRQGQAVALLAKAAKQQDGTREKEGARYSLMDVSDGLARDLPRLLGSLGADLFAPREIIHEEARRAAACRNMPPEELFLRGGEDYALLGTCPEAGWENVRKTLPEACLLGTVRKKGGLSLLGRPLVLRGFDHFAKSGDDEDCPESELVRDAADRLAAVCREAWLAGLMSGFNGNASCRVDLDGQRGIPARRACLITRSGTAKGRLGREDFVVLGAGGGETAHSGPPASTESGMHLAIYAACPASGAVLHTHPPRLAALSLLLAPQERLNLPVLEANIYRGLLAFVPAYLPGSAQLAAAVAAAATSHAAVWMEAHGLVTHGPDLGYALSLTEELEQLAKVHLDVLQARIGP